MQYVTFYVSDALYGLSILSVREVCLIQDMTPVQGSKKYINGLINLRGQIVTVMNLQNTLSLMSIHEESEFRFVILKTDLELSQDAIQLGIMAKRDSLALLVNKVGDILEIDDMEIEPPPPHITHLPGHVAGVVKLEKELLTLLSTEWLFNMTMQNDLDQG